MIQWLLRILIFENETEQDDTLLAADFYRKARKARKGNRKGRKVKGEVPKWIRGPRDFHDFLDFLDSLHSHDVGTCWDNGTET